MIHADHKKWADLIFSRYLQRLLRAHFYALYTVGELPRFDPELPLLLLPNHNTWWDGFFIYLINKKILRRQGFLMMLEEQLSQNSFFRYLGVYSIDPHSYSGVRQSLEYTRDVLLNITPAPMICIFPRGEMLPWGKGPLDFKRGFKVTLRALNRPVILCPLGMRAEFHAEQRPEVFIKFFPHIIVDDARSLSLPALESRYAGAMEQFTREIAERDGLQLLFKGKASVSERRRGLSRKEE